jgi:hypothetical protein
MSGWDLSPLETCSRDTTARDSTIQDTPHHALSRAKLFGPWLSVGCWVFP